MMCTEHIASVSNVTYESKICGLPLFSLCRFLVISVVSGHNYGDVGVRTLNQEFFTRTFAFQMLLKDEKTNFDTCALYVLIWAHAACSRYNFR